MERTILVRIFFLLLLVGSIFVSPAIALFGGIAFALLFKVPFPKAGKVGSKYLLQAAVVGLGFGMNLDESLRSSSEGMLMTIVSVGGVMGIGYLVGRWLGVDKKLGYLISSGTAICGGSAIAAISPVVRANDRQTAMSMAVIFTLNAVALFVFPTIGHWFDLSQQEFGIWAAIAIHDTSSVVGAGAAYGPEALAVATTVKLTRALWIIPLAVVSMFIFRSSNGSESREKISIPWFILWFVVAMLINTYFPLGQTLSVAIKEVSHAMLSVTLFLIGTGLSVSAVRSVGWRPIVMGVGLWVLISVVSLGVILW